MEFSYLSLLLGNTTVDELMMRLMAATEIFSAQQQEDIKDEVRAGYHCSYLMDLGPCQTIKKNKTRLHS